MNERLAGRPKPSPEQDTVGAEHQRGGDAAAIGDAACRQDQHVRSLAGDEVDDVGHQRDRAAGLEAVPAGIGPLDNEHVRAGGERAPGMLQVMHLADKRNAGRVDRVGER